MVTVLPDQPLKYLAQTRLPFLVALQIRTVLFTYSCSFKLVHLAPATAVFAEALVLKAVKTAKAITKVMKALTDFFANPAFFCHAGFTPFRNADSPLIWKTFSGHPKSEIRLIRDLS